MWGHVIVVYVKSLSHYFLVPKKEDIRMVSNGTSSGLNTLLWYPHFLIAMVGSTPFALEKGNFMADPDIG